MKITAAFPVRTITNTPKQTLIMPNLRYTTSSYGAWMVSRNNAFIMTGRKYIVLKKCGARCWWCSWLRHCATSQKVAG
jgi:hypothetical protein